MKFLSGLKTKCENIKIDEFKLCIFIFMFCGILGFYIEETYDILHNFKFDKNGFLYGLFLPIYGWGALLFHILTKKTYKRPVLTFLIIMLSAILLEYTTGFMLLLIWNKRYWDYSSYFLNINGYICLFSILSFSILGMVYVYVLEPFIKTTMAKLGNIKVDKILKTFLIIYLIDNLFSFLIKNKF